MIQQTDLTRPSKADARTEVLAAIRNASVRTGVDFAYLLHEAEAESSLDPTAQAATSSARGLFQFIDSTWLETIDKHGAKHGLGAAAAAITRDSKGQVQVASAHQRAEILRLRDDPRISALMAAELAQDNEAVLENKLGREVTHGELYMAHFLGAGGAAKFLDSHDNNPDIEAQYIVPTAARANEAVFYKDGKALTLEQVLARFESKFEQVASSAPQIAQTSGVESPALTIEAVLALHTAISAAPGQTLALHNEVESRPVPTGLDTRTARTQSLALQTARHTALNRQNNSTMLESGAASLFALSLLQALRLPAKTDSTNEWIV